MFFPRSTEESAPLSVTLNFRPGKEHRFHRRPGFASPFPPALHFLAAPALIEEPGNALSHAWMNEGGGDFSEGDKDKLPPVQTGVGKNKIPCSHNSIPIKQQVNVYLPGSPTERNRLS
jgi:hypothetical protein